VVLNEYDAPDWYEALRFLDERNEMDFKGSIRLDLYYRLKRSVKELIGQRSAEELFQTFYDVVQYFYIVFSGDKKVIVNMTPYRSQIFLAFPLLFRNKVIIQSSWPYWAENERKYHKAIFPFEKAAWRHFVDKVDKAVAINEATKNNLGRFIDEVKKIPHSVDASIYGPDDGSGNDETVILFVGRLMERKGVGILLEVARELSEAQENINFVFVGDGKLRNQVEINAENYGNIEYEGFVSDEEKLAGIYRKSDVFTLPAIDEGVKMENFGIVVIEAMASGTPPLVTDALGPSEIVEDNETGLVIPQNERESLRDAILDLHENEGKRERLGNESRRKAVSKYDVSKVANLWLEFFSD